MSEFCVQVTFSLYIKDNTNPEPQPPKKFTVNTNSDRTLLQAMQELQSTNADFSFSTMDVPTSGQYVVKVNQTRNAPNKFWSTVLYTAGNEVKPINLCYKPRNDDEVYLRFSFF